MAEELIADPQSGQKSQDELKLFLDSSWLIAIIDESDSHHTAALSSLGALKPYKPTFYITPIIYLETISRLIKKKKISVRKCHDIIRKFLSSVNYKHKTGLDLDEIDEKFSKFSRIKISKKLSSVDFYVVAEGILLDAMILTCDLNMFRISQKYYEKIYFLTDQVENKDSDLGRLISDIQKYRRNN